MMHRRGVHDDPRPLSAERGKDRIAIGDFNVAVSESYHFVPTVFEGARRVRPELTVGADDRDFHRAAAFTIA
jgi:hypothetical protein